MLIRMLVVSKSIQRFVGALILIAIAIGTWPSCAGNPTIPPRKPWTTANVVGSPEPPPAYRTVRVLPNVQFHHPLLLVRASGDRPPVRR